MYFPMIIGSNVIIEEDCVVKCLSIGSNVCIGKGSVLVRYSKRFVIPALLSFVSLTLLSWLWRNIVG